MATITMRNIKEAVSIDLVTEDCINCGVVFALPVSLRKERQKDGKSFFCPNGHPMVFSESEADKQRKAREEAERNADYWRQYAYRTEQDLGTERKSHASIKGQLTKKLVQGGVCPVDGCHRHFTNLERHMATKHPEAAS